MFDPIGVRIPVRCNCGQHFKVPVGRVNLEKFEFVCPACSRIDRFSSVQIASIVEHHAAALETALQALRNAPAII